MARAAKRSVKTKAVRKVAKTNEMKRNENGGKAVCQHKQTHHEKGSKNKSKRIEMR